MAPRKSKKRKIITMTSTSTQTSLSVSSILLELPSELLHVILDLLSTHELASLALVNSFHRRLAQPHMFSVMMLTYGTFAKDFLLPLVDGTIRPGLTRQSVHLTSYICHLRIDSTIPEHGGDVAGICLLYTSPSPRDGLLSRMPSSA